jgi:hypothetical protein
MDRTTTIMSGHREDRAAEAPPATGMPDAKLGYAAAASSMFLAVESTRVMLELNRTLLDLSRDMLRRQQDVAIAAMLRALGGSLEPDRAPAAVGFADLARLSLEAFDRMATAMRAPNDAARWTPVHEPKAERKAAQR